MTALVDMSGKIGREISFSPIPFFDRVMSEDHNPLSYLGAAGQD